MMFSPLGVVLGAALSQNVADPQKRTEIELLGGMFGSSAMGMVLLATLAQQAGAATGGTTPGQGGPTESQVPDVTKSTAATVGGLLTSRGLTLAGTETAISDQPIGTIIASVPAAGTVVARNTAVTIVVSAGLPVPNVVGQSRADAISELEPPFVAGVQYVGPDQGAVDTVVEQDPGAGTFLSKGDTVNLKVPKGTTTRRTSG
jgi:beta-lactam-binding protein with PASTA domain